MTTAEYKTNYGKEALSSPEYREKRSQLSKGSNNPNYNNTWNDDQKQSLSEKNKGRSAWNKGKTKDEYTDAHNQSIQQGIKSREEKYATGELTRVLNTITDETKLKISHSVKQYARSHPEETTARAQKSLTTKMQNGYDFGSVMRGKQHTAEAKEKISRQSVITARQRKAESHARILELIEDKNLVIDSDINDNIVTLRCTTCDNTFTRTKQYLSPSKFRNDMCPCCFPPNTLVSQGETELYEYIKEIYSGYISQSNRQVLGNKKEIDIFLPDKNIGFEYNGLYWHSELQLLASGNSPKKDYEKYNIAKDKNIRLVQVYEDEWKNNKEIVKSRIASILGKSSTRIYARNTSVSEISSATANAFIKKYHIQGTGRSNIRYGLFYNDELVSVMTFSTSNISRKGTQWEIDRFCTVLNTNVIGGANKLFSHFIRSYNPDTVISYSDNRWNTGKVYEHLGMQKDKETTPGYWYFYGSQCERIHRFTLRKNKNDDNNLTEWENRVKQGYNRVWDCGHTLWRYRR